VPDQLEIFVDSLKESFEDMIITADVKGPNQVEIVVKKEHIIEVAESLKHDMGFTFPSAAGGLDYLNENKMQMIYYVQNPRTGLFLFYRVDLPRDNLKIPTLTQVWDAMSFHEREANEMFGIEFQGHTDMRPLLLPPDWKGGYPLRKDFKGEGISE
jgi:NADH:ubiquinone oxidoreductase subunit C